MVLNYNQSYNTRPCWYFLTIMTILAMFVSRECNAVNMVNKDNLPAKPPVCSPSIQRVYLHSDATLRCTSEDPSVSLTWRKQTKQGGVELLKSLTQNITQESGFVTSAELTLPPIHYLSEINEVYTCQGNNNSQTCTVTVMYIHPVTLSVYPNVVTAQIGDTVQFSCCNHATSDVVITEWDWNQYPSTNESRSVMLANGAGNLTTISDIVMKDNATKVYCYGRYNNVWYQSIPTIMYLGETPSGPSVDTALVVVVVVSIISIIVTILMTFLYLNERGKKIRSTEGGHPTPNIRSSAVLGLPPRVFGTKSNADKTVVADSADSTSYTGLELPRTQHEYTALYAAKPKEENTVPDYVDVYPDLVPNQDNEMATASSTADCNNAFTAKETGGEVVDDQVYDYAYADIDIRVNNVSVA